MYRIFLRLHRRGYFAQTSMPTTCIAFLRLHRRVVRKPEPSDSFAHCNLLQYITREQKSFEHLKLWQENYILRPRRNPFADCPIREIPRKREQGPWHLKYSSNAKFS